MKHIIAIILATVALGGGARADELVLLSPHWSGIEDEFTEAFQIYYQENTGNEINLRWLDVGGGTSDILRYIQSEFRNKPDGIGVDIFFGGGTDPYIELKRLELLASYRLPDDILAEVAPDINGIPLYDTEEFTWYSPTMSGFGIIYNKVVLDILELPAPKTWEDLARPEYYSWVGSGDPRKSGANHMMYEIILQAYGWEHGWRILTAMGANVRNFSPGAMQTPKDVAAGELAMGLAIDFYAWAQVREVGEDMIGYVMPDNLTIVNGDAIGILKGAPNRRAAEMFLDFVMSEAGQMLWMLRVGEEGGPRRDELGRFSVHPAIYEKVRGRTSVTLNPFDWHSEFTYNNDLGSARWGIVNDLIGSMIIEPRHRLTKAWRAAIDDGNTETFLDEVSHPPVSEDEALRLVTEGLWSDHEFRNRTISEWTNLAWSRYGTGRWQSFVSLFALAFIVIAAVYIRKKVRR